MPSTLLSEMIASEVMDMIERERRINKDDLILAADMAIRKHEKAAHPAFIYDPRSESVEPLPFMIERRNIYGRSIADQINEAMARVQAEQFAAPASEGFTHPCTGEFLPFEPRKL